MIEAGKSQSRVSSSLHRCRWNILPRLTNGQLAGSGFPPLVCQLLFNRGVITPAQLELFLSADSRLSGDPFALPDMHQAIGRIYKALLSNEKIAVYGDFDVDGVTSTAVLVQGLTALGGKVVPFIPHRLTEGYGLRTSVLEELRRQGITLVVSVDCGITALPEVKKAKKLGLDVVITDHHIPREELPQAAAVINPKRLDSQYPYPDLAGVGVALKVLQALYTSLGRNDKLDWLMDLVALGTVADMVPLQGENRYLVKQGLSRLNSSPRLGIREIITQSGLTAGSLNSESISWTIAPRLNTPGRLDHALASYNLLMTDSPDEAQRLTGWLEQKNAERQRLTTKAIIRAREQVMAAELPPVLIAGDEEYPAGIAGLVANRLVEEFYRPAIVIKTGEITCSGSCRSIPEFNIAKALNECRHLLGHFGGHARAAGFSLPARNLARFKSMLLELALPHLQGVDLRPRLDIDAEATLGELSAAFPAIQQLSPFGQGNPIPAFISRGLRVVESRTMGSTGDHIRLKLQQESTVWDAVGFGMGSHLKEIGSPLDIVYNLEMDRWNGRETLRINLIDFARSEKS